MRAAQPLVHRHAGEQAVARLGLDRLGQEAQVAVEPEQERERPAAEAAVGVVQDGQRTLRARRRACASPSPVSSL